MSQRVPKTGSCRYLLAGFLFIAFSVQVYAQSTPSELARMSVHELAYIKLSHAHTDNKATDTEHWHFGYYYRYAEFGRYRDGTDDGLIFSEPIYQSLNGIQIQEDYQFNVNWKWNF